jgi:hypothetical protein
MSKVGRPLSNIVSARSHFSRPPGAKILDMYAGGEYYADAKNSVHHLKKIESGGLRFRQRLFPGAVFVER